MSKPVLSFVLVLVLAAAACSAPNAQATPPDNSGIILTAAAQTVAAEIAGTATPTATSALAPAASAPAPSATLTPAAALPTFTLFPTAAPPAATATGVCDAAQFITDVTVPDGTNFSAGESFTKTWRIKNAGTCSWNTSYALVFSSGNAMGSPAASSLAGTVNPGQTVDISVGLIAPATNGDYTSYWKLRNAAGVLFTSMYVQIHVGGGAGSGSAPFAVTHVGFTATTWNSPGYVNCPRIKAAITVNAAGTVKFRWVQGGGGTGSLNTLVFASASTQTVSADWSLGSVHAGESDNTMGIYIESPNHQDFGNTTVTPCTSP